MLAYFKKYDHRLWVLCGGWVASSMGFSLSIPFVSLYFHSELGMSLTSIGIFLGVTAIIRATAQGLGGELSDRIGRYPLMVHSQVIRSIIFFMMSYSIYEGWGFWAIGGLLVLNSIFGALFQPAANATVADLVDVDNRIEGYAIVRVAGNFGWAVGPAMGGFLASHSFSLLFIISGIMTLISTGIIVLFLRGIKMEAAANDKSRFSDIFKLKGNELIVKHAALIFILYLVVAQLITPFSLYSVDFVGISKVQLGYLFTLNGLMVTIFQIPTTYFLKKTRLTIQLGLGAIIYAAGYTMVGATATFIAFVVALAIVTMGEIFISPPALAITANLAPQGRTGRYMGIYGFAVTAGWSLGPLLGSILLDIFKPRFIFSWSIIGCLALATS
ncbi:MAG: MFS transporter, partial [Candidatus Zixiibacteriota bacterium]